MNRLVIFGLAALTTAGPVSQLSAEDPPAKVGADAQPLIVLVGSGTFGDNQLKARPTAEADAKALYDLFTNKDYLGVPAERVTLLLGQPVGAAKKATKANIREAIQKVVQTAGPDDLVIVALLGQGATLGDRTCFFASDSTFKDRSKTALAAAELEADLEKIKSKQVLALVDINFKGFDPGKEVVTEPNLLDLVRVFIGNEDKEEHTLPPGRVILQASNDVAACIDLDKHGLFTSVLLDGLKGKADTEGYEPDGLVTVDEIIPFLEKEGGAKARELGKTPEQKRAVPFGVRSPSSHYPITRNPAVTPTVEKRLAALAKLAAAGQITAEEAAEGKTLLSRMPKLEAVQNLRKQYQAMVDGTLSPKEFQAKRANIKQNQLVSPADAERYAKTVMDGIDKFRATYVKEMTVGEVVAQAIKGLYRRLDEKLPTDLAKKLTKTKLMKRAELRELLTDVRMRLGKREDLAKQKDVELTLLAAMTGNTDPYTTYISKEQVEEFNRDTDNEFVGIGIQIRRDLTRDGLLVVTPIKGSPAYRKGVKAGDLIRKITTDYDAKGNKLSQPEMIDTKGLKVEDAVKRILGKEGTVVKLQIERETKKGPEIIDLDITRGRVTVETVLGWTRNPDDDSWDFLIDKSNKIAYMRLTQFGPKSFEDMEKVVRRLDKQGIKGFILDLRFNPGGLLTAARDITDLFIDDGLIVTIRPRVGPETEMKGKREGSYLNFPMVCLINGGSASGSEIVSAALQDHHRAIIIGERSYGKGSVQNIQSFGPTGGKIKLTTASFWRPNNKNLSKAATSGKEEEDWGVRPDKGYDIKLSRKDRDDLFEALRDREGIPNPDLPVSKEPKPFKDRQLDAALDYLKSQIKTASRISSKKAS